MWRDTILSAKQAQGVSAKTMSDRTNGRLPERTIKRILNGETEYPRIDTIIEMGEAVGLTAQEIFAEACVTVTDINVDALKAENDTLRTERDAAIAEIAVLKATVDELKIKVDTLKDEIIETHKYYIRKQTSEK